MRRSTLRDLRKRRAALKRKRDLLDKHETDDWPEEQRLLSQYARTAYPDFGDRLRFLQDYAETRISICAACFENQQEALLRWDKTVGERMRRRRGDRTKLEGAQAVEALVLRLVRARFAQLRLIGMSAYTAWDMARTEIGPCFGVAPSTIRDNWRRKRRAVKPPRL